MKFVLRIEENGYELRCWDEDQESLGELLLSTWDIKEIHSYLEYMNFRIPLHRLRNIEKKFDTSAFVILSETSGKELEIL